MNIFLFLPCSKAHFHVWSLQGKTGSREPACAQTQSKSNYGDTSAASPLIRWSLAAVTSTPSTHAGLAAVSQVKVLAKSLLSDIPCEGNGAWDGSDMRDHRSLQPPVSAPEGRRWANTALISIWIPWSWQEQILPAKRRRMLLLKVLLRWNIIRQRLLRRQDN